jgi:glutamyl-tRNA reductase
MTLALIGISHASAPLRLREPLVIPPERLVTELQRARTDPELREAVILSTCNRTELYYRSEQDAAPALESGRRWLAGLNPDAASELVPHFYGHEALNVVRHLLRVASGLDSQVVGEPQILGQVKEAYERAHENGFVGSELNRLFQFVFLTAKQVRQDSGIGLKPVSVASLGVRLAEEIFDDFPSRTALLIGAGETIELSLQHLSRLPISRFIVANRSLERARRLAQPRGGYAITLDEIPDHLAEADLIFTAVQSPEPLLAPRDIQAALVKRRRSPVFIMDLGLPRNVDPKVGQLPGVFLYTLEHLESLARQNRHERRRAAETAEGVIDGAICEYATSLRGRQAIPTICALREQVQRSRLEALAQARQLLERGESPHAVLEHLAHSLTNRFLHTPTVQLREAAEEGRDTLILAARDLFGLGEPPPPEKPAKS